VAELLLHHHADVNVSLSEDWVFTLLHKACLEGRRDLVEFLLKHKADVGMVTTLGWAEKFAKDLDNNNENIYRPSSGETALHLACYKRSLEIVQLLVRHGVNVNAKCAGDVTALHVACDQGYTDIARALIRHNADINVKDGGGRTPLFAACWPGETETVRLLLQQHDVMIIEEGPFRWPPFAWFETHKCRTAASGTPGSGQCY
jgi:ankyrin repeat protein